jgi:WhiB family redox-sensing transcriptional regulator
MSDLDYSDDLYSRIDAPPFDEGEWRQFANCRGVSSDLFFPQQNNFSIHDIRAAKAVCNECLVIQPCLSYALDNYEGVGIWGGTSGQERRILRREMKPK